MGLERFEDEDDVVVVDVELVPVRGNQDVPPFPPLPLKNGEEDDAPIKERAREWKRSLRGPIRVADAAQRPDARAPVAAIRAVPAAAAREEHLLAAVKERDVRALGNHDRSHVRGHPGAPEQRGVTPRREPNLIRRAVQARDLLRIEEALAHRARDEATRRAREAAHLARLRVLDRDRAR